MSRQNVKIVVVPSATSLRESEKLMNMTESQMADEFLKYPPLPYSQHVTIDKLAVLNYNLMNKQPLGLLRYGTLRMKKPDLFPECKDPKMDFEDEGQVSPVLIVSGDQKYRTDVLLWIPLTKVVRDIMIRQGKIGKKLLPIKVFVDEKNQWMVPLMNLSRGLVSPKTGQ